MYIYIIFTDFLPSLHKIGLYRSFPKFSLEILRVSYQYSLKSLKCHINILENLLRIISVPW